MSSHAIGRSEPDIELQSLGRPSSESSHGHGSSDYPASIFDLYLHGEDHDEGAGHHGGEEASHHHGSDAASLHPAGEVASAGPAGEIASVLENGAGSGHHEGGGSVASAGGEEHPTSALTSAADMLRKLATAAGSTVGAIGTGIGALAPAGSQEAAIGHDMGVAGSSLGVLGNLGKLAVDAKKGELSLSNNWTDVAALAGNATFLGFNAYKVSQDGNPPQAPGQG